MEVHHIVFLKINFKMLGKLRSIICLDVSQRDGSYGFEFSREIGGGKRRMVFVGVSESEFCFFVYGGHNVALNAVGESDDGVRFGQSADITFGTQFFLDLLGFFLTLSFSISHQF